MIKSVDHTLLHLQVRKLLLNEITRGEFATADMLPTETDLCNRLKVSRSTLRHAVTSLEQEGYLRRRQGMGTIIDRNVCNMSARFDLNSEFSILLSDLGYSPHVRFLSAKEEPAGSERARLLQIKPDDPLLSITKLWLADDRPAILCTDSVPAALLCCGYSEDLLQKDIFSFLEESCHQIVSYQIANLFACLAGELSPDLGISPGEPIMASKAVGYNPKGFPVMYNFEVYAPDILTPSVLRAKI